MYYVACKNGFKISTTIMGTENQHGVEQDFNSMIPMGVFPKISNISKQ